MPPLTQSAFQILLALASGCTHGYAVNKFVEELTGGQVRLGPATLYRTIARLVAATLVIESRTTDPNAPHYARRRHYRLTPLGEQALRDEAALLERLVNAARNVSLLG